jgi:cob(I)alamin adenosyltransferase
MAKIYTKTGDAGKTRLWDGTAVDKNDRHIETNGAIDELNAALGLARSLAPQSPWACDASLGAVTVSAREGRLWR